MRKGARRIVLLARPGAGKSTQAARLAAVLRVAHLSTGELLRGQAAAEGGAGPVSRLLGRGDLVPLEVVERVLLPRLGEASREGGYVLDGFPRDLSQASALARLPRGERPQLAIALEVPEAECRRRLLARAQAEGRADDSPETIERRLAAYERDMRPVLSWYGRRGQLVTVDGARAPGEVTAEIVARARLGRPGAAAAVTPLGRPGGEASGGSPGAAR